MEIRQINVVDGVEVWGWQECCCDDHPPIILTLDDDTEWEYEWDEDSQRYEALDEDAPVPFIDVEPEPDHIVT